MKRAATMVFTFLLFITAGMAATESPDIVKTVEIRSLGAGKVDESFVLTHISAKQGSEFDKNAVTKDIKALLATGHFSNVYVSEEQLDDGMRLVYCVQSKLKLVDAVEIKGVENLSLSKVRSLVELEPGDMIDDQILNIRANKVEEEYRKEHFPYVSVTNQLEVTDPTQCLAKCVFIVHEGSRAKVKKAFFVGNSAIPSDVLVNAMSPPIWWKPWTWFGGMRYDPDELEMGRQEIREMYLSRGYLDVTVSSPRIEAAADGSLIVTVNIYEGVAYRFGKVTLGEITVFPESELRNVLKAMIKPGDVATPEIMDKTAQALRDYYGSRGYVNTVVRPVVNPQRPSSGVGAQGKAEGILDVQFVFTEGKLVNIRNIRITGNYRTKDKVIRREILVYPGEIFNEVKVRNSQNVLMNLGYFSDVRANPVPTRDPEQDDLAFDVDEKQTGMFSAGIGFSSIDKLTGMIGLSQGNFDLFGWPYFTGGGQKAKLSANVGSVTKQYNLSLEEPWFMDRKLSLGFDIFRDDTSYNDYEVDRTGGSISLRKALPGANSIGLNYQLERVNISNVSNTNEYFHVMPYTADLTTNSFYFTDENGGRTESSLTLSLTHDTRDNPFFPTRGMRAGLSAGLTGGPFGFDTDFYRLAFNGTEYFHLWHGHVFSLRARCEVVDSYGGSATVPLDDRLYIGGASTLRGFKYRDVGPKVAMYYTTNNVQELDQQPAGGSTLAMASAEYTIPVVKMIRVACFYDIGNVWPDAYDVDLSHMASSAGVGIRFDIPMFPIRIDHAWIIKKDNPMTESETWCFWIGPVF